LLDAQIPVWFLSCVAVTDSVAASFDTKLADLSARVDALTTERDEYRKLYLQTLEICRKLEMGIAGPKRERLSDSEAQLTMGMLQMLVGAAAGGTTTEPPPSAPPAAETKVAAHTRQKPTDRRPLPEKLPRVDVEVLPPEVQQQQGWMRSCASVRT
jgi:transposase